MRFFMLRAQYGGEARGKDVDVTETWEKLRPTVLVEPDRVSIVMRHANL
jgi:hypothetical protein